MRIIFIIKNLENIAGGAEKVLSIIASALADRGHEIKVISFDNIGSKPFYDFNSKIELININDKRKIIKNKFIQFIYRIIILRLKISLLKPDITVGFMHSIYVILAFAMLGKKINVIASEHIVPEYYKTRKLQYLLINLSSFFIKKTTVVSKDVKNKFSYFIRKKMVILPNPISINNFPEKNKYKKSGMQLLSIGRLTRQKDHETLIKAFSLLLNKFPNWRLLIIGEGPLRSELENLINKLNISNKVSLLGISNNLEKFYTTSDIFVMPSKFESFGLVTAEAMFYSLPVIGFKDCLGINRLIDHNKTGILVNTNPCRVDSLAQAMNNLMSDQMIRKEFGKAGYSKVKKYLATDVIVDMWEDLLKKNIN